MPTLIRSIEVTIVIETNKSQSVDRLKLNSEEDEAIEEFVERVKAAIIETRRL